MARRVEEMIGKAKSPADLGRDFGAGLSEAEVRYLAQKEWAKSAEDILWRRSKLGLRVPAEVEQGIDAVLAEVRGATVVGQF
jgi:glycerol-3-phosphate dehydrogenase